MAIALPFFGGIIGLVGALGFWPATGETRVGNFVCPRCSAARTHSPTPCTPTLLPCSAVPC